MKKRLFALFFIVLLLLVQLPSAAAESPVGLQKGDILLFGSFEGAPIRWQVLDPEMDNSGAAGVFLFSEYALKNQGVIYSWSKAVWPGSEGQAWCQDMLESSFTAQERAAIPAVSKSEEGFVQFGLNWGAVSLENEQLFFLSAKEAEEYIGPEGTPGLSARMPDGSGTYYWLRTPHGAHADYAGLVLEDEQVHDFLVYGSWGVRPATNIAAEALLLVTPVGWSPEPGDPAPIPQPEERVWKPTVIDRSLSFQAESTLNGSVLDIRYSGAPAAASLEQSVWISVLIRDAQGKVLSYGRLARAESASGSLTLMLDRLDLPEGALLSVFAEQDNGPEATNTASAPVYLNWTPPTPAPTPEPEVPDEQNSGTITHAPEETPAATPVPQEGFELKAFLREQGMFAIPFALLSVVAIVMAIVQAILRRLRWREDDE